MSDRPKSVRLDAARCPECAAFLDLDPLLTARDLAIVSALLQDIDPNTPRSVKVLLDRLARRSFELCTDLGYYGYDYLGPDAEETASARRGRKSTTSQN